jgi:hypothetical protein
VEDVARPSLMVGLERFGGELRHGDHACYLGAGLGGEVEIGVG